MYKIICNNQVVDLLQNEPIYVRFQNRFNRAKPTDKSSAQGFVGSDNKTVYILPGNIRPANKTWRFGTLCKISEVEFNKLTELLTTNKTISNSKIQLDDLRKNKIAEMNKCCVENITKGISVLLSDNSYHHFTLAIEDQLNLSMYEKMIENGSKSILYHENGNTVKLFSSEDMKKIISAANNLKRYQLTYYNLLKYCINNMYDIDAISNIYYGIDLNELFIPSDLKKLLDEVNNV